MIEIKARLEGAPRKIVREFNRQRKEVHGLLGNYWHKKIFPKHFHPIKQKEYPIAPRSKKWLKTKERILARFGGSFRNAALVLFGQTKRFAMHGELVRPTGKRVSIDVDFPIKHTKRRKPGIPNVPDEMMLVSSRDVTLLEEFYANEMTKRLDKILEGS